MSSAMGLMASAAVGGWKPRWGPAAGVECSSRPQKKATAHHMKTRPKKTQPSDMRRRGPTAYPPLPSLPPDWSFALDPQQQQQQEPQLEAPPPL